MSDMVIVLVAALSAGVGLLTFFIVMYLAPNAPTNHTSVTELREDIGNACAVMTVLVRKLEWYEAHRLVDDSKPPERQEPLASKNLSEVTAPQTGSNV